MPRLALTLVLVVSAACGKKAQEPAKVADDAAGPPLAEDAAAPSIDAAEQAAAKTCPTGTAKLDAGSFKSVRGKEATIAAFCLDVTEVTLGAYRACVKAGTCAEPDTTYEGCNWEPSAGAAEDHAVNCVTPQQAEAFCKSQGKRLPTADELEWAQRGGAAGTIYPWGGEADKKRLCPENSKQVDEPTTCPVGKCAAGESPQKIQDLVSQVSEWATSPDGKAIWNCGGKTDCTKGAKIKLEDEHKAGWCSQTGQPNVGYSGVGLRCAASM